MKGYFSQLARHTGLRFTSAADSIALRSKTVASATPLHVEEVAVVSPAMPIAEVSTGAEPAAHTTLTEIESTQADQTSLRSSVPEVSPAVTQVSSIDDEHPRTEFQPLEHESFQSVPTELPTTLATQTADVKRTTQDEKADRIERVQTELIPQAPAPIVKTAEVLVPSLSFPDQEIESAAHDPGDIELDETVEREVLVRQYLREVRAWVAASPTTDDSVSEAHSWIDPQSESVAFTVERESIPTVQAEPRDPIDVHDMNLSIGSISIVIEEPKPAAAAVIAPPPSAPATQPQTQHEPISLSRYYLRSW